MGVTASQNENATPKAPKHDETSGMIGMALMAGATGAQAAPAVMPYAYPIATTASQACMRHTTTCHIAENVVAEAVGASMEDRPINPVNVVVNALPTLSNRLVNATQQEAQQLIATKSNSQRGPVLSSVMDIETGEIFFGINGGQKLPPNLVSLLTNRAEITNGPTFETPGTHSEIYALNAAILARQARTGKTVTETDLPSFLLHNMALRGTRKGVGVSPRCGACADITKGVTMVGGD